MELMFWWLIPPALVIAALAGWRAYRPDRHTNARRRPVANADRLTALPEYQAALRRHRRWLAVAALAATTLLVSAVAAAARPVEMTTIQPEQRNRDIMLCLDTSGSMSGADAAVVQVFAELAKEFDGERIGLTVFDSSAVQVFPLTDDYAYVQEQLQLAQDAFEGSPGSAGFLDGTWNGRGSSLIGDGLASCVNGFPDTGATDARRAETGTSDNGNSDAGQRRSRSIVLATDNYLSGDPIFTLEQAAALAKERAVRVYALNPGDFDYGPGPGQPGARLRTAAEASGGAYHQLDSPDAVVDIVRSVQETEATAMKGASRAVVSDRPELPLTMALLSGLVLAGASWRLRP
ncbi:VWA domain-containing protein [Pseudarthrobacter sp. RMG13]|uniref:VWA domain-containing protein n=1 Tax=Pseudarthrobacter humi TaxID=2952523 RepID=A0ABT1LQU5_9MICC|nr:VWA domain-containing protein [Pseudarthrobacter humi]MCP9000810.1 VWA domain-containing protein [Pseudarthrobacter humi]